MTVLHERGYFFFSRWNNPNSERWINLPKISQIVTQMKIRCGPGPHTCFCDIKNMMQFYIYWYGERATVNTGGKADSHIACAVYIL